MEQKYTAFVKPGGARILSVFAESEREARNLVWKHLSLTDQTAISSEWAAHGQVIVMEADEVPLLGEIVCVMNTADGGQCVEEYPSTEDPARAMLGFALAHLAEFMVEGSFFECRRKPTTPRLEARPRNYERDPQAEVGDGFLSNLGADYGNMRRELEWEPRYHFHVTAWWMPCPSCGRTPMAGPFSGRFGMFMRCDNPYCNKTMGLWTKKFRKAARPTRFCGERMTVVTSNCGVPYTGCNKCYGEFHRRGEV